MTAGENCFRNSTQERNQIEDWLTRSLQALAQCCESEDFRGSVSKAAEIIEAFLGNAGLIVTCGNGGSSAEASHFAAELTGRYELSRQPFPAMCISDASYISCVANDFGYEQVFARVIQSLNGIDSLLICFSTSGESPNVVNAARLARSMDMSVISFCGQSGSSLSAVSDVAIHVDSRSPGLVQQVHQAAMHAICARLDAVAPTIAANRVT